MPVGHLEKGRSSIEFPVCHTIAHHITFKVRLKHLSIVGVVGVVLMNLVGKIGHVNAGV